MELGSGILLGLIQGLTEFLPVSSSGHLVLGREILGIAALNDSFVLTFDVFVHCATLLAVVTYFHKDLITIITGFFRILPKAFESGVKKEVYLESPELRLVGYIVVGTIPAAIAGLAFKDRIEGLFSSPGSAAGFLIVTGIILISTRWIKNICIDLNMPKTVIIGIAQAFALIPGISRSGSTISAGLWLKVRPETAAKFSFFLAIPAILGAAVLEFSSVQGDILWDNLSVLMAGGVTAFISGLIAIGILMKIIERGRFFWFGLYCISAGSFYFLFAR
ncbi:undecaprenyl-diphosphate phosphatase [candidate division KSB1 bacterium]